MEAKQFLVFGSHLSLKMTTSEFAQAGALTNQDQALAKAEEDDPTSSFTEGFARYPSIYFFDLTDKKLGWEILGGKDFISIDDDKVLYRRNDGVIELTRWKMPHFLVAREDQPPYLPALKSFTGAEDAWGTLHRHGDRVTFIGYGAVAKTYNLEEATFEEPSELRTGSNKLAVVQFVDGGRKLGGKVKEDKEIYKLEAEIGEAADGYTLSGHIEEEGAFKQLELTGFKTDA